MARRTRTQQLHLDWTAPAIAEPQRLTTVAKEQRETGRLSRKEKDEFVDKLDDAIGDTIGEASDELRKLIRHSGKSVTVEEYWDILEVALYRVVGQELSLRDDHEYHDFLTGVTEVVLELTEEECASEKYRNNLDMWAYLPPRYYYTLVEHPTKSREQRISDVRALWSKLDRDALTPAPWEVTNP